MSSVSSLDVINLKTKTIVPNSSSRLIIFGCNLFNWDNYELIHKKNYKV